TDGPESAAPDATPPKAHKATHGDHADGGKAPGADDAAVSAMADDLKAFFGRQGRAIARRVNGKDPDWWNQKTWNQELSAVLLPHLLTVSTGTARRVAGAKGLNPDDYSVAETKHFLEAVG